MTENQLNKLKNRLLNIQTQLGGASIILSKNEPILNSKIQDANKLVREVFEKCDTIKTHEDTATQQYKKRKRKEQSFSYLVPHEVIIQRDEPPTYNVLCRNYREVRDSSNKVIERTCIVGMDMCYCSKKCAYATNNVCSLRG